MSPTLKVEHHLGASITGTPWEFSLARGGDGRSVAPLSIRSLALPSGERIPVLGQGTWRMGDDPGRRGEEIAALRLGLDLGLTLVDTAEIYGDGAAEELVGEAIAGRRDEVFLISKAPPSRVTSHSVKEACERSLERLRTDRLDLYLLHRRAAAPLEDWVRPCEALVAAGKIRHWGVSNFDVVDLVDLVTPAGGDWSRRTRCLTTWRTGRSRSSSSRGAATEACL